MGVIKAKRSSWGYRSGSLLRHIEHTFAVKSACLAYRNHRRHIDRSNNAILFGEVGHSLHHPLRVDVEAPIVLS